MRSGKPGVGHVNSRHEDRGAMACGGFDFVKRGRYTGKERKAVIAPEHAGKRAEIGGLEFGENGAALGDPNNRRLRTSATQTAPSASRQMPSGATSACSSILPTSDVAGGSPKAAQVRRSLNAPWETVKAV